MRHVYVFQAQACLAHGRATFVDNDAVVYLVDDRSLQRKLSKEGCTALCGDLRDEKLYQRAHVTQTLVLNDTQVTGQDLQDPDNGSNDLQNYPIINTVVATSGSTTISGTLNSTPNRSFRIE